MVEPLEPCKSESVFLGEPNVITLRVDERVNRLSQHRGRARKRRGSKLRSRDSQIAGQGNVDNTGGRTDQRHTPESTLQSFAKPDWHSTAGEITYRSSSIRPDCVNATCRSLYQHLSHSKHQAVEWRRFLAGCGRRRPSNSRPAKGRPDRIRATTSEENS